VLVTEHDSLNAALPLGSRELVATVGGGGKTSFLQLLAREQSGRGKRIVVTTTTAVYLKDLEALGPVLLESDRSFLSVKVRAAVFEEPVISIARMVSGEGKAVGLPVEWVDGLWANGWIDYVLVEADGSRGMSLKAFSAQEPQVPSASTTIVQVSGLDAFGVPLAEPHVHRAESLAAALGVSPGSRVTEDVFLGAVRLQLRLLRRRFPAARVITLLNKAGEDRTWEIGRGLAANLLARSSGVGDEDPEMVLVGSLRERVFLRFTAGVGGS
jgi:probable selenium-dependent hydroxylase accessory protein YqeC